MNVLKKPLNPLIARELRQRARSRGTPVVITLYLAILTLVLYGLYRALAEEASGDVNAAEIASAGRTMFQTLLFFILVMVWFVVPGTTASAISGERERQTLVPLQVTLLGPWSLLLGKLTSSMMFLALLVVAALPLVGVTFILGGVSIWEVIRGFTMVLVSGVAMACLALACSSIVRRVQGSTVLAYFFSLTIMLGVFVLFALQGALIRSFDGPQGVLYPNPFMATADVIIDDQQLNDAASPFSPFKALIRYGEEGDDGFDAQPRPIGGDEDGTLIPFWVKSVLTYGVMSGLALLVAARRLRTPADAEGR